MNAVLPLAPLSAPKTLANDDASLAKPSRLGKGLSALFGDAEPVEVDASGNPRTLPVAQIDPNAQQPRRFFDKKALEELSDSIREKGILQPLLVRPHPDKPNAYELVAGERRWRAAQMAGLHEVPVVIRALKDREALEFALIENIQRADLSPMEESETMQRLIEEFGHTQEEMAKALGKSRPHITNILRLQNLPDTVKELLRQGALSAGHARALLSAKSPLQLANEVIKGGLSVRQTENLAKLSHQPPAEAAPAAAPEPAPSANPQLFQRKARKGSASERSHVALITALKDADTQKLERDIESWIGLKAKLQPKGDGQGGTLHISYASLDQLEYLLTRLVPSQK